MDEVNCFYVEEAIEYGVRQAVILQCCREISRMSAIDGWFRASIISLEKMIPYYNDKSIRDAIVYLTKKGLIIKDQRSSDKMDKTNYYKLLEK